MHQRENGIALVLVLWVLVLITITSGAFALMARMDQLEANQLLSGTQAKLAAEAGLNLAAVALRDDDPDPRIVADGRAYQLQINGVDVEFSATDERGKLDINSADQETLTTLFSGHGMEVKDAEVLAAHVLDWRDSDDIERVDGAEQESYDAAGLPVGPANRPFMMVDELLQVMGMTYDLFRQIEPGITVYSRSDVPMPAFAPVEALMAIPDITRDEALNFVRQRQSQSPDDTVGVSLPNGQTVMAQGKGLTYSIHIKATMPNGVWEQLETTIRLGGDPTGLPYRVLRWSEGFQY